MKTNSYWEGRSEQVLLDLLKDGQKAGKILDKDYQKALANIEGKIQILYGRFAQDNKVDTAKAMELIKGQDYQRFRYSMEEYLRRIGQGEAGLALEVNVLCMRKRITRLEEIEAEILANLALLAKRQEEVVGKHLEESIEKAYGRSLYLHYQDKNPDLLAMMEKGGILVNKKALQKVLETPWAGSNYSQRIWKREYDIGHKVRAAVTENILSGTSLDQVTDRVAHELKIDNQKNLYRLIYTETSYIKGQADLLAYQDLGTEEYQILATLDSRTSGICRHLDGKHYPVEEAVIGKTYPPFHPHCRTTTIRYKPEAEGTRSARGEDGKVYQVPAGLTYKDWFKKYVQKEDKGGENGYKSNKDTFDLINLKEVLEEKEYNEFKLMLSNNSNENINRLYEAYGNKVSRISLGDGAKYDPRNNELVLRVNAENEIQNGISKFSTIAHEYGHFFDQKVTNNLSHAELEKLREVLPEALLPSSKRMSASDEFLKAIREDKKHLKSVGIENLKKALYDFDASSGVQDAIDGMFEGSKNIINWGHGETYYNRKYNRISKYAKLFSDDYDSKMITAFKELGHDIKTKKEVKSLIRDYETASEAWANIMSAETCGGEELEFVKKYLSNSYSALLTIIEEVK